MELLKVFLVFTVFWQQEVFGGPTRRFRSIKNCKPLAKFKDDYLNKRKIMITNMQGLAKIAAVDSKATAPSISFPPSYLKSINANSKTIDRLDAYFKEMDKYTAYLAGTISVSHGNLLQDIKNVGTSLENYCNCPSAGQQYFVSTTPSTPVGSLTQQEKLYVKYKIRASLVEMYRSSKTSVQC